MMLEQYANQTELITLEKVYGLHAFDDIREVVVKLLNYAEKQQLREIQHGSGEND